MFHSILLFLDVGGPEMMLILVAILILFGGQKLPELARGLGKGIREFKDAANGVKDDLQDSINKLQEEKLPASQIGAPIETYGSLAEVKPVENVLEHTHSTPLILPADTNSVPYSGHTEHFITPEPHDLGSLNSKSTGEEAKN